MLILSLENRGCNLHVKAMSMLKPVGWDKGGGYGRNESMEG